MSCQAAYNITFFFPYNPRHQVTKPPRIHHKTPISGSRPATAQPTDLSVHLSATANLQCCSALAIASLCRGHVHGIEMGAA
jgi:hypothetical protein